jgi:hypothetical protein
MDEPMLLQLIQTNLAFRKKQMEVVSNGMSNLWSTSFSKKVFVITKIKERPG